jgi:hypothetical protein
LFVDATGIFVDPTNVQLKDDLTNAIIATCKGPMLQKPAIVPPAAPPVPAPQPRIYDSKIAGSYQLPDSEHQVEVAGEGKVAYSE